MKNIKFQTISLLLVLVFFSCDRKKILINKVPLNQILDRYVQNGYYDGYRLARVIKGSVASHRFKPKGTFLGHRLIIFVQ